MERPKGGIEQARRNFMREDPELYAYIQARVVARALDSAGDSASGAETGHGAANRVWSLAATWRAKWQTMIAAERKPTLEEVKQARKEVADKLDRMRTTEGIVSEITGFSKETLDDLGGVPKDDL